MRVGTLVPFSTAVVDMTGGNTKILRMDYSPEGLLPIIDQGQEAIAGYTNDLNAAYRGPLPVVLFGDHTRAFKYIDRPFVLGADGVRVLAPKPGFSAKFLYYYFLSCDIPSRGYSRHVKFLKEFGVPLFAPKEQARIVDLLDEADRLRKLRRESEGKAARILPALFLDMFGDPATNPHCWDPSNVGTVLKATDYGTSTKASDDGIGLPMIRMGNVGYDGALRLGDLKYVQLSEQEASKFRLQRADILFNRTNSKELVGKTGLWDVDLEAVLASYFIRIRVDSSQVEPMFLWALMNTAHMKRVLRATAGGAIGQANINTNELRALPMYKPPLELQQDFVRKATAIKSTIAKPRAGANIEGVFRLLLQRAFTGQLTAKWREAHMRELLEEMELQARALNLPVPKEPTA